MASRKTGSTRKSGSKAGAKSKATAKAAARRRASASPEATEEEQASVPAGSTALVIVESPAKAKTIGKYLGRGYRVRATVGHIMDLPEKKLGIDIENGFEPELIPIPGKE